MPTCKPPTRFLGNFTKKSVAFSIILFFLRFRLFFCKKIARIVASTLDRYANISYNKMNSYFYFTGKVLEVYEKGCLLEVTDIGNGNFWIGNKVMVHTDISNSPAYDVGDFLRISFDGKVAESYPPQVTTVFIVSKTDSKGNCVE